MITAANFFNSDSAESDTDEGRKKTKVTVEEAVADRNSMKTKKKKKKNRENKDAFTGGILSEKENVNSEAGDGVKKSKKKRDKKVSGGDEIRDIESSKVNEGSEGNRTDEKALLNTDDEATGKRKRDDSDLVAEENSDKSNKKKPSVDSELEENSLSPAKHAKKKRKKNKPTEDPEAEENNKDSTELAEKKQSENSEAEGNDLNSTENAKKKRKKKKQSEDPEAEENNFSDGAKDGKKKRKKKKQSEDPEAEENNYSDGAKDGKKKRKKKQKGTNSDEVVTTPSSKSTKKVKFSDQVEVFPAEDEESEEEEETKLVRGKRFTKEEDELVRKAVLEYVENHALGDEGINMIMDCRSHPEVKGCWKEIAAALPWRPYYGVYHRAHTIFEEGSKGVWSKEDLELVIKYQKEHGNDWKTLADAMGKHRKHVKDAWRRIRLASKKKGHWSREEYQNLFDLVNKDLRMKAFQEKRAKHGMLRDNIPWMAISDQLGTRDHAICCTKWYDQLTSPMVANGIWANVDDYRLLDELTNLDAACVDDVDWDGLLDNRDGDACRKRWNQMVHHIGLPGTKTFAEQVEILSQRYCPDIAEDREDFDNRPYDPED